MARFLKRILYWLLLGIVLTSAVYGLNSALFIRFISGASSDFGSGRVMIQTAEGNRYAFNVDIAADTESRAKGLMNRPSLGPYEGVWFVFNRPLPVHFWMKDTSIPLDILFVGSDHRITHIIEQTTPFSTEVLSSEGIVSYVLEVNAGTVQKLHVAVGDKIIDNIQQ